MSNDVIYRNYWHRKRLLATRVPRFPVRRWWLTDGLCEVEQLCFNAVRHAETLLDVGAGDLRIQRKLLAAGFAGRYDTLDIGHEFNYTFRELTEVTDSYDAILCLDVVEHMALKDGLGLIEELYQRLRPGGTLILQAPNARCIRHPLSTDMTHCQIYNAGDLWAFLTTLGLEVQGFRVLWGRPRFAPWHVLRELASQFVITRLLGCDYTDNLLMLAKRPAGDSVT